MQRRSVATTRQWKISRLLRLILKKKNIEISAIVRSANIDNEKKGLELKIQKWNTYQELKEKGLTDIRIARFFPALKDFIETDCDDATDKSNVEQGDDTSITIEN
jgi:hypothetical protein